MKKKVAKSSTQLLITSYKYKQYHPSHHFVIAQQYLFRKTQICFAASMYKEATRSNAVAGMKETASGVFP